MNRVALVTLVALVLLPVPASQAEQPPASGHERADRCSSVKSERKLYLLKAGRILKSIDVSLGLVPNGPKQREGDFRTPEGHYMPRGRNVDSDYFLSIHVSYPERFRPRRARIPRRRPGWRKS